MNDSQTQGSRVDWFVRKLVLLLHISRFTPEAYAFCGVSAVFQQIDCFLSILLHPGRISATNLWSMRCENNGIQPSLPGACNLCLSK